MELQNFRRGRDVYSAGRPSRWASAHILVRNIAAVRIIASFKEFSLGGTRLTRRPASADRTARSQFKATGQPVRQTQANDAMTSRLPRYEAKCVQRRYFQCGSVPLRSDIKGTERPPSNILIPLERQLIALQLCR